MQACEKKPAAVFAARDNRESVTGNKGAGERVKGGEVRLKPFFFF